MLLNKQERHTYRKLCRSHRKELIKLAKEDRDYDWSYLHELVITKIRHMYNYYSAGNNVWQTDETRIPICAQLNHILQLQDEIDHLYDDIDATKLSAHDSVSRWEKESELYKQIYTFIGEHIEEWWD